MRESVRLIFIIPLIMTVVIQQLIIYRHTSVKVHIKEIVELPIMPIVCVNKDSWMPYSEREVWTREQVISLGTIIYSQEEIDAEDAVKLRRRK